MMILDDVSELMSDYQTVQTVIKLPFEQFDLGLHCSLMYVCVYVCIYCSYMYEQILT